MTSWRARATGHGFLKLDRHRPLRSFERNRIGDVVWLIRAVDVVTAPATPPFVVAIHVDEVEVLISIAEAGQRRRLGLQHKLRLVATEAERVFAQVEAGVERFREREVQQVREFRSMRIVTSAAAPGFDRAVQEF